MAHQSQLLWLTAMMTSSRHFIPGVHPEDIELVTSLPYSIGIAPDIKMTGAAFDLAAESVMRQERFINASMEVSQTTMDVRLKHLFDASSAARIRTCDDISDSSAQMLSEYFYRKIEEGTCYAVVSSPCDDERGIFSLAREFDWPLFSTGLSKPNFYDPNLGGPTTVAASGTFIGYAKVVVEILRYYGWYSATILVEAKAIATFYRDIGNLVLEQAKLLPTPEQLFAIERLTVDTTDPEAISAAMTFAKGRSRAIVLLATGVGALKLLDATGPLGMTNGEYAFINVQPLQGDTYGKLSQFQHPLNDTTLNAFRSLLFVAYGSSGSDLKGLNTAITERAKTAYNVTFPAGIQPLDLYAVQTSYAIVELFATVVKEMYAKNSSRGRCSGREVARRMADRSFRLGTGELFINSDRIRNLDLQISGFNSTTRAMQTIGSYQWNTAQLVWNTDRAVDWPTTDGRPPANTPSCGFSGDQGICLGKGSTSIGTIVIPIAVCAVLLIVFLIIGRWYVLVQSRKTADKWWQADGECLTPSKPVHYGSLHGHVQQITGSHTCMTTHVYAKRSML
ncbi:hypothetical protein BV898_01213 [Hypsibius exemplaris]|uniref:Receptor ligand binding region domain-containing protein n=1 Tax=Hypsibius exemplaris TaxID=2072580 RepID=A0A1W0XBX0_HYPEX|nr:hypothetical protein BV898_01213 [Hypsibius exemplaris]